MYIIYKIGIVKLLFRCEDTDKVSVKVPGVVETQIWSSISLPLNKALVYLSLIHYPINIYYMLAIGQVLWAQQ